MNIFHVKNMKNVKHNVLKELVNEKLENHQRHHILQGKVKRILNPHMPELRICILKIFFFLFLVVMWNTNM